MAAFICPHWRPGQSCKPFFQIRLWKRGTSSLLGASMGIAVPALNFINAVAVTPPTPAIVPQLWIWGCALGASWAGGVAFAVHNDHDVFGGFLTAFGIPGLLVTLASLPRIGP